MPENRKNPRAYHPFAMCLMFKQTHSSTTARENLKSVVEYGMRAQRLGLTIDEVMNDITKVRE
jgi:hypothetical protein